MHAIDSEFWQLTIVFDDIGATSYSRTNPNPLSTTVPLVSNQHTQGWPLFFSTPLNRLPIVVINKWNTRGSKKTPPNALKHRILETRRQHCQVLQGTRTRAWTDLWRGCKHEVVRRGKGNVISQDARGGSFEDGLNEAYSTADNNTKLQGYYLPYILENSGMDLGMLFDSDIIQFSPGLRLTIRSQIMTPSTP